MRIQKVQTVFLDADEIIAIQNFWKFLKENEKDCIDDIVQVLVDISNSDPYRVYIERPTYDIKTD